MGSCLLSRGREREEGEAVHTYISFIFCLSFGPESQAKEEQDCHLRHSKQQMLSVV